MKKIILLLLLVAISTVSIAQKEIDRDSVLSNEQLIPRLEGDQISNEISFSLYPNPATDVVNIDFESHLPKKIEIYNILGKLILETEISTNRNLKIDISNLGSGAYLIKITVGGGSFSKKLIFE